jgi:hypothetical protein
LNDLHTDLLNLPQFVLDITRPAMLRSKFKVDFTGTALSIAPQSIRDFNKTLRKDHLENDSSVHLRLP